MRLITKVAQEMHNLLLYVDSAVCSRPLQVSNNVRFISQFANPEWAEKVLEGGQLKTSDPDWRRSGAESVEEYEIWVTTICGMACTVMALEFFNQSNYPTITLAKDALLHSVYQKYGEHLSDMRYREYVSWIRNYNLSATCYSRLTLSGIKHLLSHNSLAIVSVNPNIRGYSTAPTDQKGGHLVLITGYNDTDHSITIQNPSGFTSTRTQQNHTINYKYFQKYFAGRGIALYCPPEVKMD